MKIANIISLGCSKNLVDTELLSAQMQKAGYRVEVDAENSDAQIVIINTCGFIGDAKEESINTILEQVERKNAGEIEKILVMGCLSQRYGDDLRKEIPEIDGIFGKFDWKNIMTFLGKEYDESLRNERILTTPSHYAYLKIAEGCNRTCSYCAIPVMTGKYQSRFMEDILDECRALVKKGVKELLIMAQDLTYYGIDIYKKNRLADLVRAISKIEGVEWIKLHYAYPTGFPLDLLDAMRECPNVCKYLDIALQHGSDHVLKLMRRGITQAQTKALIAEIRAKVPGIFIRTTLMTGHPGETEADFQELCNFVCDMKFERMGVFPYSHEDDTYCAAHYTDDVPEEVKRQRADQLMAIQHDIAEQVSNALIGSIQRVIIDRCEDDYYVARTQYDSPEVDPEVLIYTDKKLNIGDFYNVKITDSYDYDLIAEMV